VFQFGRGCFYSLQGQGDDDELFVTRGCFGNRRNTNENGMEDTRQK
jgi:hypothetical protein